MAASLVAERRRAPASSLSVVAGAGTPRLHRRMPAPPSRTSSAPLSSTFNSSASSLSVAALGSSRLRRTAAPPSRSFSSSSPSLLPAPPLISTSSKVSENPNHQHHRRSSAAATRLAIDNDNDHAENKDGPHTHHVLEHRSSTKSHVMSSSSSLRSSRSRSRAKSKGRGGRRSKSRTGAATTGSIASTLESEEHNVEMRMAERGTFSSSGRSSISKTANSAFRAGKDMMSPNSSVPVVPTSPTVSLSSCSSDEDEKIAGLDDDVASSSNHDRSSLSRANERSIEVKPSIPVAPRRSQQQKHLQKQQQQLQQREKPQQRRKRNSAQPRPPILGEETSNSDGPLPSDNIDGCGRCVRHPAIELWRRDDVGWRKLMQDCPICAFGDFGSSIDSVTSNDLQHHQQQRTEEQQLQLQEQPPNQVKPKRGRSSRRGRREPQPVEDHEEEVNKDDVVKPVPVSPCANKSMRNAFAKMHGYAPNAATPSLTAACSEEDEDIDKHSTSNDTARTSSMSSFSTGTGRSSSSDSTSSASSSTLSKPQSVCREPSWTLSEASSEEDEDEDNGSNSGGSPEQPHTAVRQEGDVTFLSARSTAGLEHVASTTRNDCASIQSVRSLKDLGRSLQEESRRSSASTPTSSSTTAGDGTRPSTPDPANKEATTASTSTRGRNRQSRASRDRNVPSVRTNRSTAAAKSHASFPAANNDDGNADILKAAAEIRNRASRSVSRSRDRFANADNFLSDDAALRSLSSRSVANPHGGAAASDVSDPPAVRTVAPPRRSRSRVSSRRSTLEDDKQEEPAATATVETIAPRRRRTRNGGTATSPPPPPPPRSSSRRRRSAVPSEGGDCKSVVSRTSSRASRRRDSHREKPVEEEQPLNNDPPAVSSENIVVKAPSRASRRREPHREKAEEEPNTSRNNNNNDDNGSASIPTSESVSRARRQRRSSSRLGGEEGIAVPAAPPLSACPPSPKYANSMPNIMSSRNSIPTHDEFATLASLASGGKSKSGGASTCSPASSFSVAEKFQSSAEALLRNRREMRKKLAERMRQTSSLYESKSTDPPSVTPSTRSTAPSSEDEGEIVQHHATETSSARGRGRRSGRYDDEAKVGADASAPRRSRSRSAVRDGMSRIRSSSIRSLRKMGGRSGDGKHEADGSEQQHRGRSRRGDESTDDNDSKQSRSSSIRSRLSKLTESSAQFRRRTNGDSSITTEEVEDKGAHDDRRRGRSRSSSIQRGFSRAARDSSRIRDRLLKKRGETGEAEGGGDRVNDNGEARRVPTYAADEWKQ